MDANGVNLVGLDWMTIFSPEAVMDETVLNACVNAFAHEDLDTGKAQFASILSALPDSASVEGQLLRGCAEGLETTANTEYVLLALHVLNAT